MREAWKNLGKTPLVETIFGNIFGFYRNTFVNSCLLFNLTFLRENIKYLVMDIEVVHVTIGNPAFCLVLHLTGVYFRGKLQHTGHVGEQRIKFRSIKTREIVGV